MFTYRSYVSADPLFSAHPNIRPMHFQVILLYNIAVFLTIIAVCLSIKARVIVFMLLKVVNNVEKIVK